MRPKIVRKRNDLFELLCVIEILVIFLAWIPFTQSIAHAAIAGGLTYYPLAWTLRLTLQRHHRAGMRHLRKKRYEEALVCFYKSEAFFKKHAWVDRYRFITMFNSSAYSYHEMALHNQAYALAHLDRVTEACAALEKLLLIAPEREDVVRMLNEIRPDAEKTNEGT